MHQEEKDFECWGRGMTIILSVVYYLLFAYYKFIMQKYKTTIKVKCAEEKSNKED